MDYQKIILVGNATSDAEQRKSRKGDVTYTTFSIAVSGNKDQVTYFPVALFGKLAEVAERHVAKGRQVLVEGRIAVNDKGRFNVIADHIRLGVSTGKTEPTRNSEKTK